MFKMIGTACAVRIGLAVAAAAALGGCGTYVPSLQEGGASYQGQELEYAIVQSVHCELRTALDTVIKNDEKAAFANQGKLYAEFLKSWSVQVALTLTIAEKTAAGPTIGMSFPPGLFTLGVSGTVSAEATRIDRFNYYYAIDDLLTLGPCSKDFPDRQPHVTGSLLIRSDLKTEEWLMSQIWNNVGGVGPEKKKVDNDRNTTNTQKNGFSHQVKFEVITGGGITPGAKLATVSLNPSGIFLNASRNRIHDLTLTFGPATPTEKEAKTLSGSAQALFLSNLITSAFQTGALRTPLLP